MNLRFDPAPRKYFGDEREDHPFLGREDQRETLQGGTKESPTVTITSANFKEGLFLIYAA
jgi:hypothetical protein